MDNLVLSWSNFTFFLTKCRRFAHRTVSISRQNIRQWLFFEVIRIRKTVALYLMVDIPTLNYFGADSRGETLIVWFVVRKPWLRPQLSNRTKPVRLAVGLPNIPSIMSKRDFRLTNSFLLTQWSFKIKTIEPYDVPMGSTISWFSNLRSVNTVLRIFSIVSGKLTSTAIPKLLGSFGLVRSKRKY